MPKLRRAVPERFAKWLPGVGAVSRRVARIAAVRRGGIPLGLLALLPVAILLDVLDFFDEAVPVVGSVATFLVQTGFVLGLTQRAGFALGFSALDLIPFVDIVPVATLTTLAAIREAWAEGSDDGRHTASGPVIDV